MTWTLAASSPTVEAGRGDGEGEDGSHGVAHPGLVDVDAADAGRPQHRAPGQLVEQAVRDEGDVDAVQRGAEGFGHRAQLGGDVAVVVQDAAAAQFGGVVGDCLDAQHVFAFGVGLQGQASEVDLERGQVVTRCLDHGLESRWTAGAVTMGAVLGPEQGAHRGHVEP
jgi:hypothetical protein